MRTTTATPATGRAVSGPVLGVLCALSFSHLLNDTMQSLIPAIYPLLKDALNLDFVSDDWRQAVIQRKVQCDLSGSQLLIHK